MSDNYPNINHAHGAVTGATGAKISGTNFTSVRNAKGDYSLTLDVPVDATACSIATSIRGATTGFSRVVHTSDQVKQVLTFDVAGAAADLDFDFDIKRDPY